jgi:hypothetical protein
VRLASGLGAGCKQNGGSRERSEPGKNVYFGFGNFTSQIKVLYGVHVYICIPTRNSGIQQNQALDPKKCLLLTTFHVWPGVVLFGINGLTATDAQGR